MKKQPYIVKSGRMYYDNPEELEKKLNEDYVEGYEFDRIIPSCNGDIGFYIYKINQNIIPTNMMCEDITEDVMHFTYLTAEQLKLISLAKDFETECNVYKADVTVNYDIETGEIQATIDAYFEEGNQENAVDESGENAEK